MVPSSSKGKTHRSGDPQERDAVLDMSLSTIGAERLTGRAPHQGLLHAAKIQRRRLNASEGLTEHPLL